MVNVLRYDFYKLFKSKEMIIVLIAAAVFCILNPILNYGFINSSKITVMQNMISMGRFTIYIVMIFSTLFVCKDFTSGYLRNITWFVNKIYYVLSKLLIIFLFTLAVFLWIFILNILFSLIFSNGIVYDPNINQYSFGLMLGNIFLNIGLNTVVGALVMFLCFLAKREYIVIIVSFLYYIFLFNLIYQGIDLIGLNIDFRNYTVMGSLERVPIWINDMKYSLICLANIVWYSGLCVLLSWLLYRKRSVS